MPAVIEEIAPHPVYDEKGQHDEMFAQVRFYRSGRPYAVLRIHTDEFEVMPQVGDRVTLALGNHAGE